MHVIALSFVDSDFTTPGAYREYLLHTIPPSVEKKESLVVLPSLTALHLAYLFGDLGDVYRLDEAVRMFSILPQSWHTNLQIMHQNIARDLSTWLIPGTVFIQDGAHTYHQSSLISPQGNIVGHQRQVFLSRREQKWGLTRGDDLLIFSAGTYKIGIIVGTDAWYPETGRILARKGADLVCHCGAIPAGTNHWRQVAAMWSQVQQNQFFCVESQLNSMIAGEDFKATSQIHAPCEMTEKLTGILARETMPGLAEAILDDHKRQEVINNYPLLTLQNPVAAYGSRICLGGVSHED